MEQQDIPQWLHIMITQRGRERSVGLNGGPLSPEKTLHPVAYHANDWAGNSLTIRDYLNGTLLYVLKHSKRPSLMLFQMSLNVVIVIASAACSCPVYVLQINIYFGAWSFFSCSQPSICRAVMMFRSLQFDRTVFRYTWRIKSRSGQGHNSHPRQTQLLAKQYKPSCINLLNHYELSFSFATTLMLSSLMCDHYWLLRSQRQYS